MTNKFYISIFLFILFTFSTIFFLHSDFYFEKKIQTQLKLLSPQEKEYLENFFQYIIRLSSFGHVLFGDKPMSMDTYNNTSSQSVEGFDYMDDYHIMYRYRFKEGYETWKKSLKIRNFLSSLLKR